MAALEAKLAARASSTADKNLIDFSDDNDDDDEVHDAGSNDEEESLDLMSVHGGSQKARADCDDQRSQKGDVKYEENDDWKWFEEYYKNHFPADDTAAADHAGGSNIDTGVEVKLEEDLLSL